MGRTPTPTENSELAGGSHRVEQGIVIPGEGVRGQWCGPPTGLILFGDLAVPGQGEAQKALESDALSLCDWLFKGDGRFIEDEVVFDALENTVQEVLEWILDHPWAPARVVGAQRARLTSAFGPFVGSCGPLEDT